MEFTITLGGWILPLLLTIAVPIVAWIEDGTLGDYGVPIITFLVFVAAVVAWASYGLTLLLS